MPYRHQWFDAPKDTSLSVLKSLPSDVSEDRLNDLFNLKQAAGYVDGQYKTFHFCPHCGGWIEGHANQYEVNTLNSGHLAGRRGTEFFCCRCGERIGFFGMMS